MFDYNINRPRFSLASQLAILLLFCGAGLILGSFISLFIAESYLHVPLGNVPDALKTSGDAGLSRSLQVVSTFFFMALPSFIFAAIISRRPFKYIGFNN